MVLRSYGFMREVDPSVWGILAEMPGQADCAVELVEASLRGRIDLGRPGVAEDAFNIAAYAGKVKKNRRLYGYREGYRVLSIAGGTEEQEPYGISDAEVARAACQNDAYSEVDDEDEYRYAVSSLEGMYGKLLAEDHVDLWCCLEMALLGVPDAVGKLKGVADGNPCFSGLLRVLLSGGGPASSMRLRKVG